MMPVQGVGRAAARTPSKTEATVVARIQDANRRAKLGSFSVRFEVGSKELTPKEAMTRIAGHGDGVAVKATLVTWKMYRGGHKLVPTERKTRVKVRGIEPTSVSSASELSKWLASAEKAAQGKGPAPRPSAHPTKR